MATGRQEYPTKAFAARFHAALSVGKYTLQASAAVLLAYAATKLAEAVRSELGQELLAAAPEHTVTLHTVALAAGVFAAVVLGTLLLRAATKKRSTYMLDFAVYKPPEECRCTYNVVMQGARRFKVFNEQSQAFMDKILLRSGLAPDGTFLPKGYVTDPHELTWERAKEEAEVIMFTVVEEALKKTGLKPTDIDVLVTNCSIYNPTPSLAAMIINKFKMRSDVDAYNLGGMGCSAGVIAIGLAQKLLNVREKGGYALVVSFENITVNFYAGQDRSCLISNMIFRMGGAGIVLSDKRSERRRAKYELERLVRVHLGADDTAFNAVYQKPDVEGNMGVSLSKDLVAVAGKALEKNLTRLGPLVLPLGEKLLYAMNMAARALWGKNRVAAYVPDFRRAFDHFCLHAGGRAVVDGIGKQLGLDHRRLAPSRNTLKWFGNTSSSTVWYSLAYVEACQGVAPGDRAWQVGFGSGFKCNSVVWRALRHVDGEQHHAWNSFLDSKGELRSDMASKIALHHVPAPGLPTEEELWGKAPVDKAAAADKAAAGQAQQQQEIQPVEEEEQPARRVLRPGVKVGVQ